MTLRSAAVRGSNIRKCISETGRQKNLACMVLLCKGMRSGFGYCRGQLGGSSKETAEMAAGDSEADAGEHLHDTGPGCR